MVSKSTSDSFPFSCQCNIYIKTNKHPHLLGCCSAVWVDLAVVFTRLPPAPSETSKQKPALIICQGEVEDPPWAAVQLKRPAAPWKKIRICTYHKLERALHKQWVYNDVALRRRSNSYLWRRCGYRVCILKHVWVPKLRTMWSLKFLVRIYLLPGR